MTAAPWFRTPLLWLALLLVSASAGSGEDSDLTYRSSVSEVRLTFFATESNRNVDRIGKGDFAVVDDQWVVRDFSSFTPLKFVKLQLVVLVDGSESVLPQYRREVANVMQLLGQAGSIRDDQVSVVWFSGARPELICAGDCRTSPWLDHLLTAGANGATPLYDALVYASRFTAERPGPQLRPVFILFSDGLDTISMNSGRSAVEAALASEAQIYAIDLNSPRSSPGSAVLKNMAEVTGGRYFPVSEGAVKVLGAVLDDLHNGYLVSYKLPSRVEGFHAVQIFPTHNLDLQFRCRRGYYYPRAAR